MQFVVSEYNCNSYIINNNRVPSAPQGQTLKQMACESINMFCAAAEFIYSWDAYLSVNSLGKILNPTILNWLFISFKLDLINFVPCWKASLAIHLRTELNFFLSPFSLSGTKPSGKEWEITDGSNLPYTNLLCLSVLQTLFAMYLQKPVCHGISTVTFGSSSIDDRLSCFFFCFIAGSLAAAVSRDQLHHNQAQLYLWATEVLTNP